MKRILITGANKGIGFATTEAALDYHDDTAIILGVRDIERGQAAIDTLCEHHPTRASRLELLQVDVADDQSVVRARDTLATRHGTDPSPLFGLVNNAGIGLGSNDMEAVVNTNTLGVKRICDAFIPLVESAGRVVTISSASGPKFVSLCSEKMRVFFQDASVSWDEIEKLLRSVVSRPQDARHFQTLGLGAINAYGLSKACVSLYTMLLARENPDLFINACTPGYIETDLTRPQAKASGASPADLGMKPPEHGTVPILFLLFGMPPASGHYYGSDAKRSPLHFYRAPGDPEYRGP